MACNVSDIDKVFTFPHKAPSPTARSNLIIELILQIIKPRSACNGNTTKATNQRHALFFLIPHQWINRSEPTHITKSPRSNIYWRHTSTIASRDSTILKSHGDPNFHKKQPNHAQPIEHYRKPTKQRNYLTITIQIRHFRNTTLRQAQQHWAVSQLSNKLPFSRPSRSNKTRERKHFFINQLPKVN